MPIGGWGEVRKLSAHEQLILKVLPESSVYPSTSKNWKAEAPEEGKK
jgi:hypothetical protein